MPPMASVNQIALIGASLCLRQWVQDKAPRHSPADWWQVGAVAPFCVVAPHHIRVGIAQRLAVNKGLARVNRIRPAALELRRGALFCIFGDNGEHELFGRLRVEEFHSIQEGLACAGAWVSSKTE